MMEINFDLCPSCNQYSLTKNFHKENNFLFCEYCNWNDLPHRNELANYNQKVVRFETLIRRLSVFPVEYINLILSEIIPTLIELNITLPSSDLIKKLLAQNEFIKPCEARSYVLICQINSVLKRDYFQFLTGETIKKILLCVFKLYLNSGHSSETHINYNSILGQIYYWLTGSKILLSNLEIKNVCSIMSWLENVAVNLISCNDTNSVKRIICKKQMKLNNPFLVNI